MFYSKFMFVKKGPLFKLWQAAHNGKKLSKNDVSRVKVVDSADTIVNPSAPLALRLSSTLLLGLVRIYQRQVRYLQEDCSDALTKMKLVFRPGQIDLPADAARAPSSAITLPANFLELELDEPGLAALGLDDEDDADLLLEGDVLEGPDELVVEVRRGADNADGDASLSFAAVGGDDDGLLGLEGDDDGLLPLDDDDMLSPVREQRRGEAPASGAPSSVRAAMAGDLDLLGEGADDKPLDFAGDDDMLPFPDDDDQLPMPDAGSDADVPPAASGKAEAEGEDGDESHHQEEEEEQQQQQQPRKRAARQRKRRLEPLDDVTELSRKQISANLKDTSSIVLARRPVRPMAKRARLTRGELDAGITQFDPSGRPGDDDEAYFATLSVRLPAGLSRMLRDALSVRPERSVAPGRAPDTEDDELPLPADADDEVPMPPNDDDEAPPLPMPEDDELPFLPEDDDLPPLPAEDDDVPPPPAAAAAAEKEEDADGFFGADADAAAAAAEMGGEDAREDAGGFSRRTRKMHQVLARETEAAGDEPVSFEALVAGRSAKTVAGVFYELLVLKKHDYVQVEQTEAFGDIRVSRAAAFERPFPGSAGEMAA